MSEFDQFESHNKLPNDTIALVFGIISLVMFFIGCCCGFSIFIGWILGIIGWVMAAKALKIYNLNPSVYLVSSYNNTKTAKILSIVGTALNSIGIILAILYMVGVMAQPAFMEEIQQRMEEIQQSSGTYESGDD